MSMKYNLRTVADGAADAWDTAPESHKQILRDCSDALTQAADNIDRLRAIVDASNAVFIDYRKTVLLVSEFARFPNLEDRVRALRDDRDRLQAMVERFPKTADGVIVLPGMTIWTWQMFDGARKMEVVSLDDINSDWPATVRASLRDSDQYPSLYRWHVQACYSTREAAEKARGK